MNIVGKGKSVLDADLLAKLATDRTSGKTVSTAEVKKAIDFAVRSLKDDFEGAGSARGLARAGDAVANTLKLAIDSGWVKAGSARDVIGAFLDGSAKKNLDGVIDDLRSSIRSSGGGRTSYGGSSSGGSGRVSYGGGSSRSYSGT